MPLYGSQLWDLDCKYVNRFYVAWRKAIRKLFNVPYTTHCSLLPLLCDDFNVNIQIKRRTISFLNSLSNSKNSLLKMCYNMSIFGIQSSLSNSISLLSYHFRTERNKVCEIKIKYPIMPHNNVDITTANFIKDLLELSFYNDATIPYNDIRFLIDFLCTN